MFVGGERRATGKFVGRRLCSRARPPPTYTLSDPAADGQQHQHQHQHRRHSSEPLRLGSRGAQDYWPGRLCGVRVWGAASVAEDIRRRMTSLPSASLVRAAPPPFYGVAVPAAQEGFRRIRVHAPLPDPLESGARDDVQQGELVRVEERKAYYEVR